MAEINSNEKKMDHLSYRVDGLERKPPVKSDPPPDKRMGIEFITSVIACCIVGALMDRAFGTSPWGFLIVGLLGFTVGVWNARRIYQTRKQKGKIQK